VGSASETGAARARAVRTPPRAGSHAYGLLLGLILVSLSFQLATPDDGWARWVTIGLQSAALLAALRVSGVRTWVFRAAAVLVAVTVLSTAGILISSGDLDHLPARGVALMLVALAPIAIAAGVIREIRSRGGVTIQAMFGVLCIYLLLGMLFAFLYGIAGELADRPFFAQSDSETQSDFLYFSFATQTTTGYGDLTAATDLGRSLAITEALIGQIYLVTVVALIVGNLGRSRAATGR